MSLQTSVVGSFPQLDEPLDIAIDKVVSLQLDYGIDIITDGEQRGSMISYFEQLEGVEKVGDSLRIIDKVRTIEDNVDDFYKIVDFKKVKKLLALKNHRDTKIKVTFTGPITLGSICVLTDQASANKVYNLINRRTLYFDFAKALLPIIKRALELGALIQLDEPLLSTGGIDVNLAKEILEDLFLRLPASFVSDERVSLHVCGSIKRVPKLFDMLLRLPVMVLSFGFSGNKEVENLDIISKELFEVNNKKLGAGFISNTCVENQNKIKNRYLKIERKIGKENIRFLHPDCGFALSSIEVVKQILRNMEIVSKKVI
jgi:5-methyltetrahydropteroyltriglutamate--homocysteine methyltransferase